MLFPLASFTQVITLIHYLVYEITLFHFVKVIFNSSVSLFTHLR